MSRYVDVAADCMRRKVTRIAVVEDHPLQRQRTVAVLGEELALSVVASHETLPEFVAWLAGQSVHSRPDLLVLDLAVDDGDDAGLGDVTALLRSGLRVLVLSALASPLQVRSMLRAGVGGFVSKRDSVAHLGAAIHAVLDDETWVTPELAAAISSEPDHLSMTATAARAHVLYASGLPVASVAGILGVTEDVVSRLLARWAAGVAGADHDDPDTSDLPGMILDGAALVSATAEHGWASRALANSVRGVSLGVYIAWHLQMAVLLATDSRLAPRGWALLGGHVVIAVAAAVSVFRSRLPVSVLIAASYVLIVLDWQVARSLDQPLSFAAAWLCNLTAIIAGIALRRRSALVVPAAMGLVVAGGLLVVQPSWGQFGRAVIVTQFAIAVVVSLGMGRVRGLVATIDIAAERADAGRRAVALEVRASRAAAEAARTLHDTVINTLGAIASGLHRSVDPFVVRRRCAADVQTVEAMLAGRPDAGAVVDRLVALAASGGLDLRWTGSGATCYRTGLAQLPDVVRVAVAGAVHEAVQNAAKHSTGRMITIAVRNSPDVFDVAVRDDGIGFDPTHAPAGGGMTRSIAERCASAGVQWAVVSGVGTGTSVTVTYRPRPRQLCDVRGSLRATRDRAGWAWGWGVVAVGLFIALGNHLGPYHWTVIGLGLLAIVLVIAKWSCRDERMLPAWASALLIASVAPAFLLAAAGVDFGRSHVTTMWQTLGPTVPLAVLLFKSRTRVPYVLAMTVFVLTAVMSTVVVYSAPTVGAGNMSVGAITTFGSGLLLVLFDTLLRRLGFRAARDQQDTVDADIELAARRALTTSRAKWETLGLRSCLDLLAELGTGVVDPFDPSVRRRCEREEHYLRQLTLLSPELLRMGRWLGVASRAAKQHDIVLSLRTGDADVPDDDSAAYLGNLLMDAVARTMPWCELTVSLLQTSRGLSFTVVGSGVPRLECGPPPLGWQLQRSTYRDQGIVELTRTGT